RVNPQTPFRKRRLECPRYSIPSPTSSLPGSVGGASTKSTACPAWGCPSAGAASPRCTGRPRVGAATSGRASASSAWRKCCRRRPRRTPNPGATEVYHVGIDLQQHGRHTCECLGFLRWDKPCKHILTILEAIEDGQLRKESPHVQEVQPRRT